MKEYKKIAAEIMEAVGGMDNVESIAHCMTRLRLVLKDEQLVQEEVLSNIEGVKGVNIANGQHQIVLGTGVINKVYNEVEKLYGQDEKEPGTLEGGNLMQKISRLFGDIFIPIIPIIVASGLLMGIRTYLIGVGILDMESNWYIISDVLVDTGFSFLPVLVCYSATKKFGGNPVMGIVLGLMVLSSLLPSATLIGKGEAEALIVNLIGLDFSIQGYQGSILIAILGAFLLTKVEAWCRKFVPNIMDSIVTPILTLTITLFVILFGVGPIVQVIEDIMVDCIIAILQLPMGIGGFIAGALQQVLVITGLHHGLWIIDISLLEETGVNMYQPVRNAAILGQTGACLAFAVFVKDLKQKSNSAAASFSGLSGITEPAIFGTTLIYGMPFVFGMIGSGFGAMFALASGLAAAGMGTAAIPGILLYLDSGLVLYLISSAIALGIPFVLTAIYVRKRGL